MFLLFALSGCVPNSTNHDVDGDGFDSGVDDSGVDDSGVDDSGVDDSGVDDSTPFGGMMLPVAAGTFTMGGGRGDPFSAYTDHEVTLTHDYWLGQAEVTQAQWARWAEAESSAPSYHEGCPDCPVEQVSWEDAAMYANALSVDEGLASCYLGDGSDLASAYVADPYSCPGYRLPTEAEWEYAARAGVDTTYSGSEVLDDVAWYWDNSGGASHDVCTRLPNAWRFCDMAGNVGELTNDWYATTFDPRAVADPPGPTSGVDRVYRGGAWMSEWNFLHVTYRNQSSPVGVSPGLGFRLARSRL